MIEFMVLPMLAAVSLTLATGPLGCFIVWNRMSYFGDTLAHSALLGVTLGVALSLHLTFAILLVCFFLAGALWQLQRNEKLANDTILGILSHASLALGLVGISVLSNQRINVYGLLFGDLLTVTKEDVITIFAVSSLALALLIKLWRPLVLFVVDADLAKVEGQPVDMIRLLLMLLIALVIAMAMRVVGVLLITALLIIPAATARLHSSSPEAMSGLSTLLGLFAVIIGLINAFYFDLPPGPAIVITATVVFMIATVIAKKPYTNSRNMH